jgi:hypothetical protein
VEGYAVQIRLNHGGELAILQSADRVKLSNIDVGSKVKILGSGDSAMVVLDGGK